jgi:signal transduction histidine kinase
VVDDTVIDVEGRVVPVDPAASAVRDDTLIVHAPADSRRLARAVQAAGVALEHARLQAELLMRVAEVQSSRARIVAAGDAERRRIERDLHDGAQQRLVGLALHLQSARRRKDVPADVDRVLELAVEQTQAGVEDIRALVRGIMPPALAAGGLPAALADIAEPAARERLRIVCPPLGRLDPGLEMTAWFVVAEGVANATKHAPGHLVIVTVSIVDACLLVTVEDDGPGGADPSGEGLRRLADRVESQGGRLTVASGSGTRLEARLPCAS